MDKDTAYQAGRDAADRLFNAAPTASQLDEIDDAFDEAELAIDWHFRGHFSAGWDFQWELRQSLANKRYRN